MGSVSCLYSFKASSHAVQVSDAVLDACLAQDPDSKVSWHRSACGPISRISTLVCSLLDVVVWVRQPLGVHVTANTAECSASHHCCVMLALMFPATTLACGLV